MYVVIKIVLHLETFTGKAVINGILFQLDLVIIIITSVNVNEYYFVSVVVLVLNL